LGLTLLVYITPFAVDFHGSAVVTKRHGIREFGIDHEATGLVNVTIFSASPADYNPGEPIENCSAPLN
jgi:hypothetical protein